MGEEPIKTAEPDEGTPTPTPAEQTEKVYKQEDVDNITSKVRTRLERERDAALKQIEELKSKTLTEQEKALEDAKKAGADEVRAELEAFKRQATIERLLATKGISATDKVARLIDPDMDPEEGVAQLEADMPQLFTQTKVGGGGGRNLPSEGDQAMSEDHVNEMIQKHGPGWLTAERAAKLKQWRTENQGTIRRL